MPERIELSRETDERWRWSFSDGNGGRVFSNEVYLDLAEAERAARDAYPDLDVARPPGTGPAESATRTRPWGRIILIALLAALALALGWHLATRRQDD